MEVSAENVAWLVERGVAAHGDDLAATYDVPHAVTTSCVLVRQRIRLERFHWQVTFSDAAGEDVLTYPLTREVAHAEPLYTSPGNVGRVVHNLLFYVRSDLQKKGFAAHIHGRETTVLCERWDVHEFRLTTAADGKHVWITKFGFLPTEPGVVAVAYRRWARDRPDVPADPPAAARDYPVAFLKTLDEVSLYKAVR